MPYEKIFIPNDGHNHLLSSLTEDINRIQGKIEKSIAQIEARLSDIERRLNTQNNNSGA